MMLTQNPTPTTPVDALNEKEMVRRHMPLVRRLARSYHQRSGVELDDLIQVASMGLLRAIKRFDPGMGRLFEAYASTTIVGEILHYLRDCVPLVRPPRDLVELRPQVKQATSRLKQEAQRDPSCDEIAQATGLPVKKVAEIIAMDRYTRPLSLDAEMEGDDDGAPIRLQLMDHKYRTFQLATEDRIMLFQALSRLRPVSYEVIDLFFFQDLSQQQIATQLGISQTQVSRRIRMAIRDLLGLLGQHPGDQPSQRSAR